MSIYILGAGPAGLSLAYYLSKIGITTNVIELSGHLGGMARTWEWNNFLLETGPHLLHTPLLDIWKDWEELLGDNLIKKEFYSANYLFRDNSEYLFDYPLNLPQVLESSYWSEHERDAIHYEMLDKPNTLLLASANSFSDYVNGLVGPTLSNSFYKRYPEKVWGIATEQMLPDWAPKRLRICEEQESFFRGQYSGISALGSGDLFVQIRDFIVNNGSHVFLNEPVSALTSSNNRISSITTSKRVFNLENDDLVVSTVPVGILAQMLGHDYQIDFRGITSVYLSFEGVEQVLPDPYSWLYFSEESVFNRITEPTKLSRSLNLLDKVRSYVVCERAFSAQDFVSSEELKRDTIERTINDFQSMPIFSSLSIDNWSVNVEPWVYPIQTHENKLAYREVVSKIMSNKNIEMIGTGANYAYNDMQVIFKQAKELASDIANGPHGGSLLMSTFADLCPPDSNRNSQHLSQSLPTIIAEIGINHNGDFDRLKELAVAACASSEIVKLQYFQTKERIGSQVREVNHVEKAQDVEESISDILSRCELSLDNILEIKNLVESRGRAFMCTAFSISDAEDLVNAGIHYIKTASMDLNNYPLHRWLASCDKPLQIFVSTGMSTSDEVRACMDIYKCSPHKLSLLACTSSYPAPDNSLNLSSVKYFCSNYPSISIGYSDHSVGNNACLLALSYGASVLEVHFTDNTRLTGPDQILSKTNSDISLIVDYGSFMSAASGSAEKNLHTSEFFTWKTQRKSLFASVDIQAGDSITYENTVLRSPPLGISPVLLESGAPLIANRTIQKGKPIVRSSINS